MNCKQLNFIAIVRILRFQFAAFFLLVSFAMPAYAQVKFTTIISSKEIGRSDYIQVEFVVENAKQIEHLAPPSFPDFHIVEGHEHCEWQHVAVQSRIFYIATSKDRKIHYTRCFSRS